MFEIKYLIIPATFFLQSCVGNTSHSGAYDNSIKTTSAGTISIKQQEEIRYAKLLPELQAKNPVQDAQTAIREGDLKVIGFQTGRGGLKLPGIDVSINRCGIRQADGMGDIIYGKNHLRYRIALRQYATQFNQTMLPYCR